MEISRSFPAFCFGWFSVCLPPPHSANEAAEATVATVLSAPLMHAFVEPIKQYSGPSQVQKALRVKCPGKF